MFKNYDAVSYLYEKRLAKENEPFAEKFIASIDNANNIEIRMGVITATQNRGYVKILFILSCELFMTHPYFYVYIPAHLANSPGYL